MQIAHVLIDLERSIKLGHVHYWKPRKMGYTTRLDEAGWYNEDIAKQIVNEDYDHRTVAVPKHVIDNILK